MNEGDLQEKYNEMNIRLVKLESIGEHHSTRIIEFRDKHSDLDGKLDRLRERVDVNTKEILAALGDTGRQVANLRGWIVGLGVGGGVIFAVVQAMGALGLIG